MSGRPRYHASTPESEPDSGNDWKIVGVGDFNGDGKPDLVWQHKDGWLSLWYMNGFTMLGAGT